MCFKSFLSKDGLVIDIGSNDGKKLIRFADSKNSIEIMLKNR